MQSIQALPSAKTRYIYSCIINSDLNKVFPFRQLITSTNIKLNFLRKKNNLHLKLNAEE